jgi:hypothetical protein
MKVITVILLSVLLFGLPSMSHGFGLLKYIYDGVSNQLGLDRGPIPKAVPKTPLFHPVPGKGVPGPPHAGFPPIYIQAEGF